MINKPVKKIAVVGTGFVGSTTAYTLMVSGLVSEIVLIDLNMSKAEGEVMDLNHGMPFVRPVRIYSGTYEDCSDSDIVIIAAGANQKPGETRIDLAHKNTVIFKDIISKVISYNNHCILLVVTNPVDILTYVTWKVSNFPKNRVIGSGTVLDTARFKYLLGEHVGLDSRNIHAYILGEHGDTEVAIWSLANIAGIPMDDYCKNYCGGCKETISRTEIYNKVRNAAYNIIDRKGATYYAVALAVKRIVETVVRDENSILTISSHIEGQYGINDVCISLPTVVNKEGISKVLEVPLSDSELEDVKKSAQSLKQIIKNLDI